MSHLTPSSMKWKNKPASPRDCLRLEPGDTYLTRLRPLSLCFVYCFGQRDTLCLCAFFPFIATQHEDFATQRSSVTLRHIDMQEEFHSYLEGATPTRFGPRPRKSDRGPSFSKIDLQHKGRFFYLVIHLILKHLFVQSVNVWVGRFPTRTHGAIRSVWRWRSQGF